MGRRLQGAVLILGVQNAGLASGDQNSGQASDGSARDMDQEMLMRKGGTVGVMLSKHGWVGEGKYYPEFKMLAWPLGGEEHSSGDVG